MNYEEYLVSTDTEEKLDNGFCPFTRQSCMSEMCGAWKNGCGIVPSFSGIFVNKGAEYQRGFQDGWHDRDSDDRK